MNSGKPMVASHRWLAHVQSETLRPVGKPDHFAGFDAPIPQSEIRTQNRSLELSAACSKFGLQLFLHLDVDGDSHDFARLSLGVALHDLGSIEQPAVLSIRQFDAKFVLIKSGYIGQVTCQHTGMLGLIIGMNVAHPRLGALPRFQLGQVVTHSLMPVNIAFHGVGRYVVVPHGQPRRMYREF